MVKDCEIAHRVGWCSHGLADHVKLKVARNAIGEDQKPVRNFCKGIHVRLGTRRWAKTRRTNQSHVPRSEGMENQIRSQTYIVSRISRYPVAWFPSPDVALTNGDAILWNGVDTRDIIDLPFPIRGEFGGRGDKAPEPGIGALWFRT